MLLVVVVELSYVDIGYYIDIVYKYRLAVAELMQGMLDGSACIEKVRPFVGYGDAGIPCFPCNPDEIDDLLSVMVCVDNYAWRCSVAGRDGQLFYYVLKQRLPVYGKQSLGNVVGDGFKPCA